MGRAATSVALRTLVRADRSIPMVRCRARDARVSTPFGEPQGQATPRTRLIPEAPTGHGTRSDSNRNLIAPTAALCNTLAIPEIKHVNEPVAESRSNPKLDAIKRCGKTEEIKRWRLAQGRFDNTSQRDWGQESRRASEPGDRVTCFTKPSDPQPIDLADRHGAFPPCPSKGRRECIRLAVVD